MTNPQTEARAIARKILEDYGLDADEHFVLAESIATALAAKDAELAKVRAAHQTYVGKLTIAERALAERAGGEVTEAAHGVVEAFRFTAMKSEQLRAYHALIRALRGGAS